MWVSFGSSVIGASHVRGGKPNQDSFYCSAGRDEGAAVGRLRDVAAVSDGHGGARYIRSDKGAWFATRLICKTIRDNGEMDQRKKQVLLEDVLPQIAARFYMAWTDCVEDDLQKNPFTAEEIAFLQENCGEEITAGVREDGKIAYGCTVQMVAAYDDMILTMQLGDGNILFLYGDGTARSITADDPRMMANETFSLCDFHSEDMRYNVFMEEELPVLATLSSDGVVNSFVNKDEFMKIPQVLRDIMEKDGIDKAKTWLENFLRSATEKGSGDDVTLAVLYAKEVSAHE